MKDVKAIVEPKEGEKAFAEIDMETSEFSPCMEASNSVSASVLSILCRTRPKSVSAQAKMCSTIQKMKSILY